MNYLTNYYKNKAELLEKKINSLQRNISFLMERAETPSLQMGEPTFDQADAPVSAPFSKNALAGPQSTGTSNTTPQEYVREKYQVLDAIQQLFYEWYRNFLNTNGRHPTQQEMVDGYRQIYSQNLNFSPQYLAWVQQQIQRMNQQGLDGNEWAKQFLNPSQLIDWQQLEWFLEQNGYPGENSYPWRMPNSNDNNQQWMQQFYSIWRQYF